MYSNSNEILEELMNFYDENKPKGFSAVQKAELIGQLHGEDAGNALIRGFYGTRTRYQLEKELSESNIVQLAQSQSGRINKEEVKWAINNPIKAWRIKQIGDQATQEAIDEYGTDPDVQTYGKAAEYRHARRDQISTKELGSGVAEYISTIHETYNPHFDPNDPKSRAKQKMDLEKSGLGRFLQEKHPNISDEEMRKKIKEEVEKGKYFFDYLREEYR